MSEEGVFYDLPNVDPSTTDEVLLARGREPKKTSIGQLLALMGGAISFNQTPPDTGHLWGQLDGDGNLIELWQRQGELWLSQATYPMSGYRGYVTGSRTLQGPMPFLASNIWVESFSFQCIAAADFKANEIADFQLRFVNSRRQQVVKWYLRLEDAVRNQAYQQREAVGLVVDAADAVALWFRVQRNNRTGLRYCSISTVLRKVYAST